MRHNRESDIVQKNGKDERSKGFFRGSTLLQYAATASALIVCNGDIRFQILAFLKRSSKQLGSGFCTVLT
jgi:hypothetical protein